MASKPIDNYRQRNDEYEVSAERLAAISATIETVAEILGKPLAEIRASDGQLSVPGKAGYGIELADWPTGAELAAAVSHVFDTHLKATVAYGAIPEDERAIVRGPRELEAVHRSSP